MALLAMTIDHVGSAFFPEVHELRLIGRAALPIFCYSVAIGSRVTRDRQAYFVRIMSLAFLSQVPWMLGLGHEEGLNICFTLGASLPIIWLLEQKKFFYALLLTIILLVRNVEYSLYAWLLIQIMRFFEDSKKTCLVLLVLVTSIYTFSTGYYLQIFAVIVFPMILYINELRERLPVPRAAFYAYYPFHLMLIFIGRLLYV